MFKRCANKWQMFKKAQILNIGGAAFSTKTQKHIRKY